MKIICINGVPRSGKSTFVSFCLGSLGIWGYEISTVDFVKEVAKYCGWNGKKTLKDRKFLSDLKDLLGEWNDVPFQKIKHRISHEFLGPFKQFDIDTDKCVAFVHSREPEELQRFKDELGARTLLIRRPEVEEEEQSNHADKEVFNFKYDYIIENTGDIEELDLKANELICQLLNELWESHIEEEF